MSLRFALGVVGAIAGTFVGNPQLGFMIGSTIGSLVDPGTVKGPSIGDLAQQSAQEGGPRPIVFVRSPPIGGNVIAQSEPRIVKTKTSGKGGPSYVSESVYRTYAIGVCEGPVGGFRRVWRNNVLVYDATSTPVLPAEDSEAFLEKARFFLGTYTQDASPDLEAIFGAGTTPAHRGTCYMVLADEDLTDLRGAIPQWTFEVTAASSEILSTDVLDPWVLGTEDPREPGADDLDGYTYRYWLGTGPQGTTFGSEALAVIEGNLATTPTGGYVYPIGWSFNDGIVPFAFHKIATMYSVDPGESTFVHMHWNRYAPSYFEATVGDNIGVVACGAFENFTPPASSGVRYHWSSLYIWIGNGLVDDAHDKSGVWRLAGSLSGDPGEMGINPCASFGPGLGAWISPDNFIQVFRQPHKPAGTWEAVAGSFHVLAAYAESSQVVTQYPLNPILEVGSDDDNQAYWEAAYAAALADGDVPGGWVYGVDYPAAVSTAWAGIAVSQDGCVALSTIVTQICARAGLPAHLIDVSLLQVLDSSGEEPCVYGLAITNQYPAVEALRSLGQMYFFDISPRNGLVTFVPRGLDTVATIVEDDMVDDDQELTDDKRDDSISVPRVLNLNYHDVAGGLNTDKQTSERAGDRRSVAEASIQSPVIMPADMAAQSTVINHKTVTENAKGQKNFAVSDRFIGLCTADCVFVITEGTVKRMRIEDLTILDGYQQMKLAYDRQSAYTSNVEGYPAAPQTSPPSSIVGPTLIVPLDIPILRDVDDGFGLSYYVAVSGLTAAWRGAIVELSYDGGANYIDSRTALASATIGELTGVFLDHPQEYPDTNSVLDVRIDTPDAELEATDLPGMLNRTNLAAVGAPATSWELINFANVAEQSTPGEWSLDHFLRGRKDTTTRQHDPGETFVLLERGIIGFQPAELTDLGRTLTFRATSIGAPVSTGTVVSMDYTGQSQTERHPGYVQVIPGTDSNGAFVTVSWMGVGRLGGGAQAAHGVRFAGYRVTFDDNVNAPVVIETDDTTVTQSTAAFATSIPLIDDYVFSTFLPIQKVIEFGGDIFGIYPAGDASGAPSIRKFDAGDGTYLGGVGLVNPGRCTGFFELGGLFYVSFIETAGGGSVVAIIDPADVIIGGIYTPLFTHTGIPGDYQGLATDGTDIYVCGLYSNTILKLSAATLGTLATLSVAGGPSACYIDGTTLFAACRGTDQVAVIDLGTFTEVARFSCVEFPMDLIATPGAVFVQGTQQVGVYEHDGTNLIIHNAPTLHSGAPFTQELAYDGARVFRGDDQGLTFYSGLGGEVSLQFPILDSNFAGGFAAGLYFVTGGSGGGDAYGSITQSATVTVEQLNDLTGAGPGIEVTLP